MKLECRLSGVKGRASAHSYDVEIINIARGELHLNKDGWVFSTRKGYFDRVADQLGRKVEEYWEKVDELNNPFSRA
ncbi:hypothetical protein KRR40_12920 [Niabella defluvii]|nr:hypothetical protein KRR40_12920 [Niabella sp. I65]